MRHATEEETAWCNKLRRLMRKMPTTMKIFADGRLHAIDSSLDTEVLHPEFGTEFQALRGVESMGDCDGGDPWCVKK